MNADLVGGAVSNTTSYPQFYIAFSLKFAKDGKTAAGTVEVIAPALYTPNTVPARSIFCESKRQGMSVSLQAPASQPAAAPSRYLYDSKGRIIGEVLR
jgi:hypothetical protein